MTPQPSLFDAPATRGASRKGDPSTSRAAGRSMEGHLRDQQALVLVGLARLCRFGLGATAFEVWAHLGAAKENVVSKRLGELEEMGMARRNGKERPGSSHRSQKVWEVTERGRAWVDERGVA